MLHALANSSEDDPTIDPTPMSHRRSKTNSNLPPYIDQYTGEVRY